MTHIVLDATVVINNPEILSFSRPDTKLIVPDLVLRPILDMQSSRGKELTDLLEKAQENGTIVFSSTASPKEKLQGGVPVNFASFSIAGYAKYLVENGNTVILGTDDAKLATLAKVNGIRTFNSAALLTYFSTNTSQNANILRQADRIETKARWSSLINILIALVLLTLFVWFIRNYGDVLDCLAKPFLILVLVLFGFGLFEVRHKRRQLYGIVEFFFGALTIVVCIYPSIILTNWDLYLKVIAGLYVIVRGLDNIHIGSEGKSLGSIFKKMFQL
jgi:hypothetical protein